MRHGCGWKTQKLSPFSMHDGTAQEISFSALVPYMKLDILCLLYLCTIFGRTSTPYGMLFAVQCTLYNIGAGLHLVTYYYMFQEFEDPRDADDAVYELNGRELLGARYANIAMQTTTAYLCCMITMSNAHCKILFSFHLTTVDNTICVCCTDRTNISSVALNAEHLILSITSADAVIGQFGARWRHRP